MKKKSFVAGMAALALAFMGLALTGCASMVVTDKNVPVEERATLYLVGENYNIDKVDGKRVGFLGIMKGPKGTGGGFIKKELKASAQIPPGEHTITIYHGTGFGNQYSDVTYDFQPGRKYRIDIALPTDAGVGGVLKAGASGDIPFAVTEITGEIPKE